MDAEVALFGFGLAGLDCVKTVLEVRAAKRERGRRKVRRRCGRNDTTAIITAYNEEDSIVESISALKPHFVRVLVANDGSTDRTSARARAAHPDVTVLDLPHAGKVAAQRAALAHVKTPYVGMFDADIAVGPEFRCPRLGQRTAAALSVVPRSDYRAGAWLRNALIDQQKFEYKRTMELGRRAQALANSTFCVSGAAGLFRTRRLRQQFEYHSGTFAGDDLERTLIELLCDGRVGFEDATVETDVPKSIGALARQRVRSWWPGMWRNLALLGALALRRGTPMRSRLELAYLFASTLVDPLKLVMLVGLLLSGKFALLAVLYLAYVALDAFVCRGLRGELDLRQGAVAVALSPLYGAFQIGLRTAAFGVFAYQRFVGAWHSAGRGLAAEQIFAPAAAYGFVSRGAQPTIRIGALARPLAAGLAAVLMLCAAPACGLDTGASSHAVSAGAIDLDEDAPPAPDALGEPGTTPDIASEPALSPPVATLPRKVAILRRDGGTLSTQPAVLRERARLERNDAWVERDPDRWRRYLFESASRRMRHAANIRSAARRRQA